MVFVELLKLGLAKKKARNPRYSLRALSRDCGVDAAMISKIFAGKLLPTASTARKISAALALPPSEIAVIVRELSRAKFDKGEGSDTQIDAADRPTELEDAIFEVISGPHHYAILELTYVKGFKSDPRWIAKRLGLTTVETEYAIARLIRLGLLENRDGVLSKTSRSITTKDKDRSTAAHRAHQRTLFRAAQQAIETVPLERRSHTGMTMAIDPTKVPAAKKLILEFNQKLSEFLETGERQQVYQLSIGLFPLDSQAT